MQQQGHNPTSGTPQQGGSATAPAPQQGSTPAPARDPIRDWASI